MAKQIDQIKRSDIDKLLTNIANERGTVMAARVLATLRHLFNWHVNKTDDFNSPLVRGRKAAANGNGSRERTLSDEEIRALWAACNTIQGPFGAYVKFTLLTATRRNEAARIARTEIDGTDWTIPGTRYKTKREHLIPLSPLARRILASMPKIDECAFYFTTDGKKPIGGFGKPKEALDALMLTELRKRDPKAELENWTLHDLRRTARSLMSRAGVSIDHAERALGHAMAAMRGTYDPYAYHGEKLQAFEKLAALVDEIVGPKLQAQLRKHADTNQEPR